MNKKKNKGITLIALVITIIILLILAGISIASLTESGLFERAKESKQVSEKAQAKEEIKLVLNEWKIITIQNNITFENFLDTKVQSKEVDDYELLENKEIEIYRNGYYLVVDSNANIIEEIQKAGTRPLISNISIKLENGTEPEDNSLRIGTPLIIDFKATINGIEITNIKPQLPYTTSGTNEDIKFEITGEIDGNEYKRIIKIPVKSKYKEIKLIEISEINANKDKFYCKPITNYTKGDSEWNILLTDQNSIYLIAKNLQNITNIPEAEGIVKSTYKIYTNKNRETLIDYLKLTSNWQEFVDTTYAISATGGVMLEQFTESWNVINPENMILLSGDEENGWYVNDSVFVPLREVTNNDLYSDFGSNATYWWLMSRHAVSNDGIYVAGRYLDGARCNTPGSVIIPDINNCGVRPLVKLSPDVKLIDNEDGTYSLTK